MRGLGRVLTAEQVARTAAWITTVQRPDGSIPWFPGGHTDPWDHVEAAMALDVGGLHEAAAAAYTWLARSQRPDGSWAMSYRGRGVADPASDANFCAYPAVGVFHHYLATADAAFAERLWPVVRRGLDVAVSLQAPGGEVRWARDADGRVWDGALLTSCSSIHHSLRCGLALAEVVGDTQPDWELALGGLAHAITAHPERFEPKGRWAMDWYYPVLGGAVRGDDAFERIASGWSTFVVEGLGVRCVSDRPWVTVAETCELALALDALGEAASAVDLLAGVQHLREEDGSYWTGYVFDEGARWPAERTTWTAAAVLLAADAVAGDGPQAGVFRAAGLPSGVDPADVACCSEPVGEPGAAL